MDKVTTLAGVLVFVVSTTLAAFELATEISRTDESVTVRSNGYANLNLIKIETSLTGSIVATGVLNVQGTANIVMWVNVEGRYYFSRMPELQGIKDTVDSPFRIPFDAADKIITEVVIQVELLGPGSVTIGRLGVAGG